MAKARCKRLPKHSIVCRREHPFWECSCFGGLCQSAFLWCSRQTVVHTRGMRNLASTDGAKLAFCADWSSQRDSESCLKYLHQGRFTTIWVFCRCGLPGETEALVLSQVHWLASISAVVAFTNLTDLINAEGHGKRSLSGMC
jgi:hypothetical protein